MMAEILGWPAGEKLPVNILEYLKNILDAGDIMVYPADTLYGMGASIYSDRGIDRIYRVKERPASMPLTVMASEAQIKHVCRIPDIARPFIESADTRITAILPARDATARIQHEGTIAVRLPCSELMRSLVEYVGPVTATSANIHGKRPPNSCQDAIGQFDDGVAVYIDSGKMIGVPTTIIDFTGTKPKVIRDGVLSPEEVLDVYG